MSLGLNIEIFLYTLYDNRRTKLGIGPLVRYYIGKDRVYGFAHFSYLGKLIMFNTSVRNEFQSKLQPGVGIGYMLTSTVGIDALFKYEFYHTNDEFAEIQNYTSSSLNIGLQIYLPLKTN